MISAQGRAGGLITVIICYEVIDEATPEAMPRKTCPNCQRPPLVCYCSALVQVANTTRVLIIQHPQEQKHPFNTGRMAHMCLSNSELIVAETLSATKLASILNTPSALLYPSLPWLDNTLEIKPETKESAGYSNIQQLIVIDATWNKSKKILHRNPALQELPRLHLKGNLSSNYQIRKTTVANGLSTLESIVKALSTIEPKGEFDAMLQPFEMMIGLQLKNCGGNGQHLDA
ncbi:MAG: DTW domain-containing protein YfiP [Parasphingorhabdus sp.]|jgi:DTW domain-containing protein YfiP